MWLARVALTDSNPSRSHRSCAWGFPKGLTRSSLKLQAWGCLYSRDAKCRVNRSLWPGLKPSPALQTMLSSHLDFKCHELEDHLQGEEDGEGHIEDV